MNSYEDGGIKMIDIEILVKAVRLAWLKRIFSDNESTRKFYLLHLLHNVGGLITLNAITQWTIFQLTRFSTENS